jgi:hypothetical protein
MRIVLLSAFVLACGEPSVRELGSEPVFTDDMPAELMTEQAAPPFGTLTLTVPDALYIGETATFTFAGLHPGEDVYLMRSANGVGPGPCFRALGGECFDIAAPTRFIGSAIADLDGNASLDATVGPVPDGQDNAFQAVAIRGYQGAS